MIYPQRDHGGGIDAARAQYGGALFLADLSTGINPTPYPLPVYLPMPDGSSRCGAMICRAAREF